MHTNKFSWTNCCTRTPRSHSLHKSINPRPRSLTCTQTNASIRATHGFDGSSLDNAVGETQGKIFLHNPQDGIDRLFRPNSAFADLLQHAHNVHVPPVPLVHARVGQGHRFLIRFQMAAHQKPFSRCASRECAQKYCTCLVATVELPIRTQLRSCRKKLRWWSMSQKNNQFSHFIAIPQTIMFPQCLCRRACIRRISNGIRFDSPVGAQSVPSGGGSCRDWSQPRVKPL
mmetsp:Transcript_3301/g.6177  ORF Transcript_3301/g.6177 Transcript_3301/m.6177 type:complete len:229 (-) Transcript_3301:230-916(-)